MSNMSICVYILFFTTQEHMRTNVDKYAHLHIYMHAYIPLECGAYQHEYGHLYVSRMWSSALGSAFSSSNAWRASILPADAAMCTAVVRSCPRSCKLLMLKPGRLAMSQISDTACLSPANAASAKTGPEAKRDRRRLNPPIPPGESLTIFMWRSRTDSWLLRASSLYIS